MSLLKQISLFQVLNRSDLCKTLLFSLTADKLQVYSDTTVCNSKFDILNHLYSWVTNYGYSTTTKVKNKKNKKLTIK